MSILRVGMRCRIVRANRVPAFLGRECTIVEPYPVPHMADWTVRVDGEPIVWGCHSDCLTPIVPPHELADADFIAQLNAQFLPVKVTP